MVDDKPSATERIAQYFADMINAGEDRKARRIQKEDRFRNSLGVRLKVAKPDNTEDNTTDKKR